MIELQHATIIQRGDYIIQNVGNGMVAGTGSR